MEIKYQELQNLADLVALFDSVESVISRMKDKDEYDRLRTYINDKYEHSLNYTPDRFKEEKK